MTDAEKYERLMSVAIGYQRRIESEWGDGYATDAELRQQVEEDLR